MKRSLLTFLLSVIVISCSTVSAAPVEINTSPALSTLPASDLDVSLRLIGGRGAVLMPGRDLNLTFQTSSDAYVIIYNIDSNGYVHLLFPADGRPEMVSGRKVHFLPEQGAGITWEVGGDTGIEYIHAVAVQDPSRIDRDELYYLAQNSAMPEDRRLRIDMDPFLAFNMIDEELIEDAEQYALATDHTYFYINREVNYPGYLCYKCHSPSNIPDPYEMECPEVDIEMIAANEDAGYPYPRLYAVIQAGSTAPEDEYESYTYYADNLSLGYDDYEYDETKVYLSVYYNYGYYPYSCYWPGYWSWYVNWCPSWYWNISWGIGWGWGSGCYYHHYPFYSWYPYSYHSYWNGYRHGYWDGYYAGGGYYYPEQYSAANRGSVYAGRSFKKRGSVGYASSMVKTNVGASGGRSFTRRGNLDYTSTKVKSSREATIASSRLATERNRVATARSYRHSKLARQVTREKASTGFRSFDSERYNTGRSRYDNRVYGNYGSARSARSSYEAVKRSERSTNSTTRSKGSSKLEKETREYFRRSTKSGTLRSKKRENVGSELERRVRSRQTERETRARNTDKSSRRTKSTSPDRNSRKTNRSSARKSSTRSGTSARSTKDSGKSDSGKSSSSRKSSSRDSGARRQSRSSSSTSSNSGRSSTRSSSTRSSGNRSSGRSTSGRKSSSGRKR
jgi:hypothetical protein